MSSITIHLDNLTDVNLNQFCGSTASARDEVIKALIKVTRNDRYISGRVTDDLGSLQSPNPQTSGVTVDLGNTAGMDLKQWCGDADPAKAIEAMVRVMLRDHYVRDKVSTQLRPGGFSPF